EFGQQRDHGCDDLVVTLAHGSGPPCLFGAQPIKFSLDDFDCREIDGDRGSFETLLPRHALSVDLQAGWTDIEASACQPLAHRPRQAVVAVYPDMPLIGREAFHLPALMRGPQFHGWCPTAPDFHRLPPPPCPEGGF